MPKLTRPLEALSLEKIELIVQCLDIMAHQSRLLLLFQMRSGRKTVKELVVETGLRQANVSKHLGVLREARLVRRERVRDRVFYSVPHDVLFKMCDLVEAMTFQNRGLEVEN